MRHIPVLVWSAVALASCATGAVRAGPAKLRGAEYHPLAVGNQWTYAGKMMGQPIERTITITGIKDGYFADDAGGLLRVDAEGLRDTSRYLLKDPIERGKTWMSIVSVSSTEHFAIADVGFTIHTPAGSFDDCVLVRATNRIDANRSLSTEWTFAPHVGIVRIRTVATVGGREIPQALLELSRFSLAKPAGA